MGPEYWVSLDIFVKNLLNSFNQLLYKNVACSNLLAKFVHGWTNTKQTTMILLSWNSPKDKNNRTVIVAIEFSQFVQPYCGGKFESKFQNNVQMFPRGLHL